MIKYLFLRSMEPLISDGLNSGIYSACTDVHRTYKLGHSISYKIT